MGMYKLIVEEWTAASPYLSRRGKATRMWLSIKTERENKE